MRITIGVASNGSMLDEAVGTLFNIMTTGKHGIHFTIRRSCYVHQNRRIIVEEAKLAGSDYLFFYDTDMYAPFDTLERLLAHNKMIVGVNYNLRGFPLTTTVRFAKDEVLYQDEIPKELFKCYAVGTGCMLINMKVFEIIDKPYFWFEDNDGILLGEDMWFCREANRKGIEVWCDPTISVKHLGLYPY